MTRKTSLLISIAMLSLGALSASAHPGHSETANGVVSGFLHPFAGWDHLLAIVAVGLWAAQRAGRAAWAVPLAFILSMTLGGVLATLRVSLPLAEFGILTSLLVVGLLVATAARLPLLYAATLVGLFAVFHGHAHVTEMPPGASPSRYVAGFITATALLHLAGLAFTTFLSTIRTPIITRACGALMTLAALALWVL
jgi:urease accessory protein